MNKPQELAGDPGVSYWRDLLDASADAVIEYAPGAIVVWATPSVRTVLGWDPNEIVGKKFDAVAHEDQAAVERINAEVVRKRLPKARYRVRSVCRDGSLKWTDTLVRYRWTETGKLASMVAAIRDISDLVAAEDEVLQADQRFRLAMLHAAVGMAIVAPNGGFLEVNPALCQMLGRSDQELMSATWQALTHPEDLGVDQVLVSDVLAGRRDSYRLLKRYLRPDGAVVWGDLSVSCVREGSGEVKYFISQITDVTVAVESREALADFEERYRLLADHSSDVVMRLRNDGIIDWVSPSAQQVVGLDPEAMVGTPAQSLVAPEYRSVFQEQVLASRASTTSSPIPLPMRMPNGSTHQFEIVGWPVLDGHGNAQFQVLRMRDVEGEYRVGREVVVARETLRAVLDSLLDPHVVLRAKRDADGTITDFVHLELNAAASEYLNRAPDELIGHGIRELFGTGESTENLMRWCTAALESREPVAMEDALMLSVIRGIPRRFDVRVMTFAEDWVSLMWRDVTERFEAKRRLADSEQRFRLMADRSTDVVALVRDGVFRWLSPSLTLALGWTPDEWIGHGYEQFVHPDDLEVAQHRQAEIEAGATRITRLRLRHHDGSFIWVEVHAAPFTGMEGESEGIIASFRLIDHRFTPDQLEAFQERHDELTGLLNRDEVHRRLTVMRSHEARTGNRAFLGVADVDNLRSINDNHGYAFGDELLRQVARRARECVRDGDLIARVGGDEILLVLDGIRTTDDALKVLNKVLAAVNESFEFRDVMLQPRMSIGMTEIASGQDVEAALSRAQEALHRAKEKGGNHVEITVVSRP